MRKVPIYQFEDEVSELIDSYMLDGLSANEVAAVLCNRLGELVRGYVPASEDERREMGL